MVASIQQFKSTFKTDLAKASRFDVQIYAPLTLWTSNFVSSRDLSFRVEAAQLPGRTFATADQRTYGPIEKFPYLSTYNDIDLTILIDDDMKQKAFFDAWMQLVSSNRDNNMNYKSEYATSIIINQYDNSNNKIYSVELINAYPISMNQLDLDWSSDSVHKLSMTFAYTYWRVDSVVNFF